MSRARHFSISGAAAGVAACLFVAAPALANGGDFFEELSASWHAVNPDEGVSYFGFIKDTKGRFVPDVTVSATTATGSSFVVQSDAMGHYRVPGFSKSVDAKKVVVSCSKPGYRLVTRDRRIMRSVTNAPIETNCVMEPAAAKPAA